MKPILYVSLFLMAFSCATPRTWKSSNNLKSETVSFKHGSIEVTPIESFPRTAQQDVFVMDFKIKNTSKKMFKFKTEHIFVMTPDGNSVAPMSDGELQAWSNEAGAFGAAIAGGGYLTSQHASNSVYSRFQAEKLKERPIPPGAFLSGKLWFLIPNKNVDKVTVKFFETLKSKKSIVFKGEEKKKRKPASKRPY